MSVPPSVPRRLRVDGRDAARRRAPRGVAYPAAALLALACLPAAPLAAQAQGAGEGAAADPACQFRASGDGLTERLSPPDSSSVRLGEGVAKVCYGSPRARGRDIMGGLVPYGEPWRLGANEPTTLHLTTAALVGDVDVGPGSYSLYAVPGRERWKLVVNGATDRWGIPIDASVRQQDVGSVTVPSGTTEEHVEALSIELRPAGDGAAEMVIAWERTRVSVPLRPGGS